MLRWIAFTLLFAVVAATFTYWQLLSREPEFDRVGEAREALNVGEYDRAKSIAEPLAQSGNRDAQYLMAHLEAFGLGAQINRVQARDWAARAGADGERGALECFISRGFIEGQYGQVDVAEAEHWRSIADGLNRPDFCDDLLAQGV